MKSFITDSKYETLLFLWFTDHSEHQHLRCHVVGPLPDVLIRISQGIHVHISRGEVQLYKGTSSSTSTSSIAAPGMDCTD